MEHPAYGLLRPVTETASVLLCDNPGRMTLDGTNTWVLRGRGSDEMVVVDPGPDDRDEHIERLAALGRITLVLISHRHEDHTGGIDRPVPPRSFGRLVEPGEYRISVTKPAMFANYLVEQLTFLIEDYDVQVYARLGGRRFRFRMCSIPVTR